MTIALAASGVVAHAASPTEAEASAAPRQLGERVRLSDMIGAPVYDARNRKIGPIEEVVFERNGRVAAVVLEVGSFLGIGGKSVALGLNDLSVAAYAGGKPRFRIDLTKDQLQAVQSFDLERPSALTGSSAPAGPPRVDSGD